jgi:MFS family permease
VPLFLVAALGTTLLVLVQSGPVLLLSGVLMGLGAGMEFTLLLYMVTRYFGLREFGRIAGMFLAGTLGFGAVVPLILNGTFDLTGSYDPAIYAVIAVLVYSGGAILAFGPYRYAHAH